MDVIGVIPARYASTRLEGKVLLDIAKEEKTHMGEFQAMLLREDEEQRQELKEGEQEVEELLEKDLIRYKKENNLPSGIQLKRKGFLFCDTVSSTLL